jgi:hypothetical protein
LGLFFTLLFWGYFFATYASYLFGERRYGAVPVAPAFAALAGAWLVLPWDTRVPLKRLLDAPTVSAAASFLVVRFTGFGPETGLYSVAVGNTVFLFGLRWAIFYAVALVPLVFADPLRSRPGLGALGALEMARTRSRRTNHLLDAP